jgi:endo-1,4-beta-xylanase
MIPDWLIKGHFTRDDYNQILTEQIKTLISRYKGKVTEWSIANEAISRSQYPGSDFWMDKIGPDYIEIAFRAAREADPNAILIFNDNDNESPRDANTRFVVVKMVDTVKTLKARGAPVDVVGMQMHLLLKYSSPIPPKKADVIETMKKFGALGVKVYITEFDVDVSKVSGTQEQKWAYEADLYRDMFKACLEYGVCTNFSTWGISDSNSWITCLDSWCSLRIPSADPLMFDRNFNPKPSYFAIRDVLQQSMSSFPTVTPTP